MYLFVYVHIYVYIFMNVNQCAYVLRQRQLARNQEFFSAGKVSENKGTSINIQSATYERKATQGKNLEILSLDTLKAAF